MTIEPRSTSFFSAALGVFQGGGCRGAAFAGAFDAAAARGVHFVEVAGTSAGSVAAALIGAGATPLQATDILRRMDFSRLLAPPVTSGSTLASKALSGLLGATPLAPYRHILTHNGLYSTAGLQKWLEGELEKLLPNASKPITFGDLLLPTWIVASDLVTRKVRVWSGDKTPNEEVARAVVASCAIPMFFQPVDNRYVDGGALSNLPSFVFENRERPLAARILAFSLQADPPNDPERRSLMELIRAIMSTIVDGSQDIQLKLQDDVHLISIPTGDVQATDFDRMTAARVDQLITNGARATHAFFDDELARVQADRPSSALCYADDDIYSAVAEGLEPERAVKNILISENDAGWVRELFPALFTWRIRGVSIRVLLRRLPSDAPSDRYGRRILKALGAEVVETKAVPIRAYIFNGDDRYSASAVVRLSNGSARVAATRYEGSLDFGAIASVRERIERLWSPVQPAIPTVPRLVSGGEVELTKLLRKVKQYSASDIKISIQAIPIDSILAMPNYVREFKYRQMSHMIRLFRDSSLGLFDPAIAELAGDVSYITPPVVERSSEDHLVAIDGMTRITFCRDNRVSTIKCVVVDGVHEVLPAKAGSVGRVGVIGRNLELKLRYKDFNPNYFRYIEDTVHPLS
jgi:predicted acylesterase/phospholipase RssA